MQILCMALCRTAAQAIDHDDKNEETPLLSQFGLAAAWGAWLKAAGLNEDTPTVQLKDSDSAPA